MMTHEHRQYAVVPRAEGTHAFTPAKECRFSFSLSHGNEQALKGSSAEECGTDSAPRSKSGSRSVEHRWQTPPPPPSPDRGDDRPAPTGSAAPTHLAPAAPPAPTRVARWRDLPSPHRRDLTAPGSSRSPAPDLQPASV